MRPLAGAVTHMTFLRTALVAGAVLGLAGLAAVAAQGTWMPMTAEMPMSSMPMAGAMPMDPAACPMGEMPADHAAMMQDGAMPHAGMGAGMMG